MRENKDLQERLFPWLLRIPLYSILPQGEFRLSQKSVRRLILIGAPGALVAVVGKSRARAQRMELIDIPYERFKLKNSATVIVHEEHKTPIVAVNVWQEELCQRVLLFRPPN